MGYTPVFDAVFNGTLCGRWPTLPVWLTLLPMADKNGHIDRTPQAISAVTGWPLELLLQAIKELQEPDPSSRSPTDDGRRLALLDPDNRNWGWRVVNHGIYREKARKAAYDAERTQSGTDAARKKASRDVPRCPDVSRAVPLSDSDSDSDLRTPKPPKGDVVFSVFEHWKSVHGHPRARLDSKRQKLISKALESYSSDDLLAAIEGYKKSDWHQGKNERRAVFDDIEMILRDAGHIDKGIAFNQQRAERWV